MVMLDRETNRSKGFGFITYTDASGVQAALACIPIELDGRTVSQTYPQR
jgi:RNA recognition motif-containing protein